MPLTKEEEMLVDAGRAFLDPLYYRQTGGGAVFGDSLDIEGYSGGRALCEVYFFPRHVAIMRMACS